MARARIDEGALAHQLTGERANWRFRSSLDPARQLGAADLEVAPVQPPGKPNPPKLDMENQVWRQLWRALERSDIAVFVLDARLPYFHFQQAMWDYVTKVRLGQ